MADAQTLQVQTETWALCPQAVSLALRRVSSLLPMAPEPVLFARVKLRPLRLSPGARRLMTV